MVKFSCFLLYFISLTYAYYCPIHEESVQFEEHLLYILLSKKYYLQLSISCGWKCSSQVYTWSFLIWFLNWESISRYFRIWSSHLFLHALRFSFFSDGSLKKLKPFFLLLFVQSGIQQFSPGILSYTMLTS